MRLINQAGRAALAAALCAISTTGAVAQQSQRYDIAAQDLGAALKAFSAASGREVVADSAVVAGKQAQRVSGSYPATEAIARLLAHSGLRAEVIDGAFVIRPSTGGGAAAVVDGAELVVTGTRIRGAAPVGSPVVVVGREQIDRSGRATVAEMIQTIPQNFGGGPSETTQGTTARNGSNFNDNYGTGVNLRGLGTASTLVLFDGVRPSLAGPDGNFTDISLLPATAIERIELLTDGASAIYGTDAVAGVVNLRFRNKFQGLETRFRTATADGDYTEIQASQLAGTRWSGGGAMIAAEYSHRGRLANSQRSFVSEDLRPFGGPDLRSNVATPGTIIAANGAVFGIPAGQDGTQLTAAQLIPGQQNRSDQLANFDLLPAITTYSVYASADQQVGPVTLYTHGLYARRSFGRRSFVYGQSTVTVPVSNAFYVDPIGTRQPISVQYDFQRDFGSEGQSGVVDSLSVVSGVTGHIHGWDYEFSGTYGRELSREKDVNIVNTARLNAALADSNRATAFNVFGSGGSTNPATIAAIRGRENGRTLSRVIGGAIRISGTLVDLPAGALKLALGVERRNERLSYDLDVDRGATPFIGTLAGLPGNRNVSAAYSELLVPLLSDAVMDWFPGELDASIAGRIERYSDVGRTSNPKFGVSWRLPHGITARGSYGRSFRAPFFRELVGTSQNLYGTIALPDPQSPTGTTNVLGLFGFPGKLGPERARTLTAGVDVKPDFFEGLNASATYFRIDYRDRIASASVDVFNFLNRRDVYGALIQDNPPAALVASYYADPLFVNFAGVPASSIAAIVNGYTLNLSRVVIDGVDFDINYTHDVARGQASIGVAGSRTLHINQRITPGATAINTVGMLGSPVKLRLRGHADWTSDGFFLGTVVNYTGGYTNQLITPNVPVRSNVTFDGQIGVTIPPSGNRPSLKLALSAINLLDRNPPYVRNPLANTTTGYDPEQASPLGRVISLQAIIGW